MKASKLCTGILLGFLIVCFGISNQSVKAGNVGGFEVTGGNLNVDYSYDAGPKTLTVKTAEPLTLSTDNILNDGSKIVVENGCNANLTLSNLKLEVSSGSAFELLGNSGATITLQEGSTNQLKTSDAEAAALQKGGTGTLTIQGTGILEAEAKAGAGIGGSKTDTNVQNIIIQGNCMVTGKSVSGAGIGAGEEGKVIANLQILGESTIVKSIGKKDIVEEDGMNNNWAGLVFIQQIKGGRVNQSWVICSDSFVLDRDLDMTEGEWFFFGNEKLIVNSGKTLKTSGVKAEVSGRIYNNGTISHSGAINFSAARIMPGSGKFVPRLDGNIRISPSIKKVYTGRAVVLEKDIVKDDPSNPLDRKDYGGAYDGEAKFKWYKDNAGQKGEEFENNGVPKDAGTYHVGISADEGNFFKAVAEQQQKAKVVIEKAEPTVTVTAGPAMVNQKVKITATVTGVNGEKPTGNVAFKIEKSGEAIHTTEYIAVSNGTAEFEWTPAEKTTYSVTAAYVPAADGTGQNYREKQSPGFSLTVNETGSSGGGILPGGSSSGGGSSQGGGSSSGGSSSQGGGSSSGGGSSQSGNSSSTSNTTNITKDNKPKEEKKEEKKEQDKKEKQKESKKETKSAFKDVKAKDKSYQAIKFAVDKGLLKEKNHKFNPSKKITAKDVVSVLYKLSGKAEDKKVSDKKELVKAEAFLKESKILSKKEGDFVKSKEITKEQLIQLLYNYAEYKGYNTKVKGKLDALKDSNKLSKSAKTPMKWALENGLITEKNNKLSPKSKVTRKELATILYHFVQKEANWK